MWRVSGTTEQGANISDAFIILTLDRFVPLQVISIGETLLWPADNSGKPGVDRDQDEAAENQNRGEDVLKNNNFKFLKKDEPPPFFSFVPKFSVGSL